MNDSRSKFRHFWVALIDLRMHACIWEGIGGLGLAILYYWDRGREGTSTSIHDVERLAQQWSKRSRARAREGKEYLLSCQDRDIFLSFSLSLSSAAFYGKRNGTGTGSNQIISGGDARARHDLASLCSIVMDG